MSAEKNILAGLVMGSKSDWDAMSAAHELLKEFGVPHECRVLSAHRTPGPLADWVESAEAQGAEVFIAGAGLAAALPGVVASITTKPVLGVPLAGGALNGQDALYAIVQMPPGIPVGTLSIGKGGAVNAALLAVAILANKYPEYAKKLAEYRAAQAKNVLDIELPGA
ncbi:MAG TPA: 5-(carboxyamino)imidazole ribonucleotide mutase [Candidatus Hydrogenedentes bacterium]|nr:5-(carboxyamino)imidazole ribonucleotide mutase [Candidatus Hydrogenedentota bacterium]